MFAPFAEFLPDQSVTGLNGASVAKNVVPLTARSYGPFASHVVFTDALDAACQGATAVRSSDGNAHLFAGDGAKLYKLNGSAWTDVSKAGGYNTPTDGQWFFVQIGDRIVATNYVDAIQSYVIGSSTDFADLSAGAPKARFLAVVKGALVVAHTNDGTDGEVQNRVWWPSLTDPTSWPTPGSPAAAAAQSDFSDIAFGGAIFGILGGVGSADGVIWLQNAIEIMTYSGPPTVFNFYSAERGIGTTVPGAIVHLGQYGAGYISEHGFNLFNGASSIPIGDQKVDRFFLDNVDQATLNKIRASYHPKRKLAVWAYQTGAGSGPDRMLVCNLSIQRWSYVEVDTETILPGLTAGFDLDTDTGHPDDPDLDVDLPSFDSAAYQGGRPLFSSFDTDHKFGFFDGDNLEAVLETGEFLNEEGGRSFITGVMGVTDALTFTTQVGERETQSGTVTWDAAISADGDRFCGHLIDTPHPRVRMTIAAAQSWTHASGIVPRGERDSEV